MSRIAGDTGTIVEYGDGRIRCVTEADRLRSGDLSGIQRTRTQFVGFGGITLTTVRASFGKITLEELQAGATAVEVTATSDGRGYCAGQWHREDVDGAFSDETVYVERYSAAGREFHGFIDKVSRKIVQAG